MENEVVTQMIRIERRGTIAGRNVSLVYENKPGELPTNVNGVCNIPSATDPMKNTSISVNVSSAGHKNIQILGSTSDEERFSIVSGIEAEIALIFTPAI